MSLGEREREREVEVERVIRSIKRWGEKKGKLGRRSRVRVWKMIYK